MSATPTESATSMTGINGCGTTSRRTTADDQQVVMGRSRHVARSGRVFTRPAPVSGRRPFAHRHFGFRLTGA